MNIKIVIRAVFASLAVFIVYTALSNILQGEKARAQKFILRGRQYVESENIYGCIGMIAENYRDKYGNDKSSLIYGARQFFSYYDSIFVHIEKMDIELDGAKTQADVTLVALVIGKSQDKANERILEGEKGRVGVKLIKEDKHWKILELEFFEPISIMGQQIS